MNILLGTLEDNIGFLIYSYVIKNIGLGYLSNINYPFGHEFTLANTNQPGVQIPMYLLSKIIGDVALYNLFVLFGVGLTLFVSYKAFNFFFKNKFTSIFCSLLFVFSPYFYYHARSHIDLIQVWVLVWYVYSLIRSKSLKHYVFSGVLLALTTLFSNYLGFFGLLFTLFYFVYSILLRNISFKKAVFSGAGLLVAFAAVVTPFLYRHLEANYINVSGSNYVTIKDDWKLQPTGKLIDTKQLSGYVSRSYTDFITFSSRPWYYLLPPVDNPVLGEFSKSVIFRLQNDWNYWLTFNHFKSEQTAVFFGITNLVIGALGFWSVRKDKKYLVLGLVGITLLLFTLPPYFTINLRKIYTPTHLIFLYFPMFRAVARLGVLILFVLLIFSGSGYKLILNKINNKRFGIFVVSVLFIVSLVEFFVPIKLTNIGNPPLVYAYIKNNLPMGSPLVVYPYSETSEAIYWYREHKGALINPRQAVRLDYGFDSEDFTKSLTNCKGILEARNLGATYLVYFDGADKDAKLNKDFFDNTRLLIKVGEFKHDSNKNKTKLPLGLGVISQIGDVESNNAVLYKLNQDINYDFEKANCLINLLPQKEN